MYNLLIAVDGSEGSRRRGITSSACYIRGTARGDPCASTSASRSIPAMSASSSNPNGSRAAYRRRGWRPGCRRARCSYWPGPALSRHLAVRGTWPKPSPLRGKIRADQIVLEANGVARIPAAHPSPGFSAEQTDVAAPARG